MRSKLMHFIKFGGIFYRNFAFLSIIQSHLGKRHFKITDRSFCTLIQMNKFSKQSYWRKAHSI